MRRPVTATPPARGGPPRPSTTDALSITRSCTSASSRGSAVHDEAAVHAEGLTGHVARAIRGEEADDGGDVFGSLHAAERHRLLTLPRELLGRHAEQRALLARDLGPHVGLDEAGADAVDADPVRGVREREALGHADDGGLAGVVRQVRLAADLAGHGG